MSITYISANAATVTNNSKTIRVVGEYVDFSQAQDYLAAVDNGLYVLRVASGTAPDSNGDSTLTLVDTWQGATLSNKTLFIFPTFAKIYESVTAMNALNDVTRGVLVKFNDLLSETSPTIDIPLGQTSSAQVVPYGYLVNEVQGLLTELGDEVQGLLTTINGSWDTLNAMTKQEFDALAEKRIRDGVASGSAEWGKNLTSSNLTSINEGLGVVTEGSSNSLNGQLSLGTSEGYTSTKGVSRTGQSIFTVNGIQHTLDFIAGTGTYGARIQFPPAPDGTKTYDSATGVVTQHASAAEAFEGAVTNGNFRDGTNGWSASSGGTFTEVNGKGRLTYVTGAVTSQQTMTVESGREYIIKFTLSGTENTSTSQFYYDVGNGDVGVNVTNGDGTYEVKVTAANQNLLIYPRCPFVGYFDISNVSVTLVDEKVITSRQDYVLLESWHEKIADKGEVYPLGCPQTSVSSYKGIPLLTRSDGYTRFGQWDTTTTGKYAIWDDLNFAEKDIFLSDRRNNIYKDGDDLIQARYRIRVIEGLGDEWAKVDADVKTAWMGYSNSNRVRAQGMSTSNATFSASASVSYNGTDNATYHPAPNEMGAYGNNNSGFSHNGLCFAVPIALVQRRNIGAFHKIVNPNGCRKWRSASTTVYNGSAFWYASWGNIPNVASASEAFNIIGVGGNIDGAAASDTSGYIGAAAGFGRPDEKAYNAIYASDVKDLRMSSRRVLQSQIRKEGIAKARAGKIRGFEAVPFTKFSELSGGALRSRITAGKRSVDYTGNLLGLVPSEVVFTIAVKGSYAVGASAIRELYAVIYKASSNETTFEFTTDEPFVEQAHFILAVAQTHKQANPTWTDIIGGVSELAATFPNGVEGELIAKVPPYPIQAKMNRKATSTSLIGNVFTDNNGASWTSGGTTINHTTNTYNTGGSGTARVFLITYTTQAHFTEDADNADNAEVLDSPAHVGFNSDHRVDRGNLLTGSLLGKVAVGSQVRGGLVTEQYELSGLLQSNIAHLPLNKSLVSTPVAVKTLDYLSEDDGVGYINLLYKEMMYDDGADSVSDFTVVDGTIPVAYNQGTTYSINTSAGLVVKVFVSTTKTLTYTNFRELANGDVVDSSGNVLFTAWDGNGWGDDNMFQVVNGQESFTDDNGNTGLRGTARFPTQYFIDRSY